MFGRRKPAPGLAHEFVPLPDPPDSDAIRVALCEALRATGLFTVIFGPGSAVDCLGAAESAVPILATTDPDSDVIGRFPGQHDIGWFAIEGPAGSALTITFGPDSDDAFRRDNIDLPLDDGRLAAPFQYGIVRGLGARVPAGYAEIFADSQVVSLSQMPGLGNPATRNDR